MENSFEEQFLTIARKTALTEKRKKAIKNELIAFIDSGGAVRATIPLRHDTHKSNVLTDFFVELLGLDAVRGTREERNKPYVNDTALSTGARNEEMRQTQKFSIRPMPIFATLLMVALIGGGTSFAAEQALPGDTLYPVKIHVNEEVKAAFSFSSENKADWDAQRAERRLEETADLAAEGKLNAETQIILEENFQQHANRVEERIAQMQEAKNPRAAATVASRFETSLKAHDQILERIGEARINVRHYVEPLEIKVGTALRAMGRVRAELESGIAANDGKPETKVAAEGKLTAATNSIASVRAFIENRKEKLGTQAVADAEMKIIKAEGLVVAGQAKIEAGLYGEAFNLGNSAIRIAQEVKLLAKAAVRFNTQSGEDKDEQKQKKDPQDIRKEEEMDTLRELDQDEKDKEYERPSKTPANRAETEDEVETAVETEIEIEDLNLRSNGNINIQLGL